MTEMSSVEEKRTGQKELHKLQVMLKDIEETNDIPSPEDKDSVTFLSETISGGNHLQKPLVQEAELNLKESLLERKSDLEEFEDDLCLDDEDSWLLKTPLQPTGSGFGEKPKYWLTDNIRTPELNRVKGSLASKLDLISIQNRKDKLNSLLAKHNIGQHSESAPGRLYQAESMCSIMSLDWEYDEDQMAFSPPYGRPMMASESYELADSPVRRRNLRSMEEGDDFQPMSLKFETSPPQRSFQVAPGPITRRVGSSAMTPAFRSSSLSDKSDSSGEHSVSPRSSLGSSRNSLELSDEIAIRKPKTRGGRKILLPISSFFEVPIPEETLENIYEKSGKLIKPWEVMLESKSGQIRSSNGALSLQAQGDSDLTVKLPVASPNAPVIRRRGGPGNQLSQSSDSIPRSRRSNIGSPYESKDRTGDSIPLKSSVPRPRTAIQSAKRATRALPRSEISQSPDVVPRRGRSPERRSRSPDIVPRKMGIVPRGQGTGRY